MGNGSSTSPAASPTASPPRKKFSDTSGGGLAAAVGTMAGPPMRPKQRDVLAQRPSFKHQSRAEAKLEEDERRRRENELAARALERARKTVEARKKREAEEAAAAAAIAEEEALRVAALDATLRKGAGEKPGDNDGGAGVEEERAGSEEPQRDPVGWLKHLPATASAVFGQQHGEPTRRSAGDSEARHQPAQHVASFQDILSAAQSRAAGLDSNELLHEDEAAPAGDARSSKGSSKKQKHHKKKKVKRTATEKVIVDASKRHLDASTARPFQAKSASQRRDEEAAASKQARGGANVEDKLWTCAVCSASNKRSFVRCGTCQSGRDVTVAADLLRRVKKARKVVLHHLKRAKDQKKKSGHHRTRAGGGSHADPAVSACMEEAKDVAKRWLLTAFATSIEVIAHKFVCDGDVESAQLLVKEHAQICEVYWRFRTVWLGALNVGLTLSVVLGDAETAASYARQLFHAFCKAGQQSAVAATTWRRKKAKDPESCGDPPPASQIVDVLNTLRQLPPPVLAQPKPAAKQAQSSAEFFADKFGAPPSAARASSVATEEPKPLANGEVPAEIHFRDLAESEVSEVLLQILVFCMNLQAFENAASHRQNEVANESASETKRSDSTGGRFSSYPRTPHLELPCDTAELDKLMEAALVSAGLLLEDPSKWEEKTNGNHRRSTSDGSNVYLPSVDLSDETTNILPCIRRRLLVLNEVYLSRGNILFNLQTRTIVPAPPKQPGRRSSQSSIAESEENSPVAAYTQSFLDSAAPLSFQLFSPVCEGIAPERLSSPLAPLLHAAVSLRAIAVVEILVAGGYDPNERDAEGDSALHCACMLTTQAEHMAKTLLDAGADPNCQDNEYCTPLHYAASVAGNAALVALLLLHGGDPSFQDSEGVTPAEYATATGDQEMILLLINSHKKVHVQRRASWGTGSSHDSIHDGLWRAQTAPGGQRRSHSFAGDFPTPVPDGNDEGEWIQCWDEATGYAFFQNTRTGESQWLEDNEWAREEAAWRQDMQSDDANDGGLANVPSWTSNDTDTQASTQRGKTDHAVAGLRSAMQGFANKAAKPFAEQLRRVQSVQEVALEAKTSVEVLEQSIANKKKALAAAAEADGDEQQAVAAALQDSIERLEAEVAQKQHDYDEAQKKISAQELKLGMQQALILKEKDQIVQSFTSSVRRMEDMVKKERSQHRANLLRKLQLRKQKIKRGATGDKARPSTVPASSGRKPGAVDAKGHTRTGANPSIWAALAKDTVQKTP